MGKWADLVLTGAEQDKAAVESMDRMYQQDMARKNARPPTTMRDPLPRFGGPKNYPENAASVPPDQVAPAPSGKWSERVLGGNGPQTAPQMAPASQPAAEQGGIGPWLRSLPQRAYDAYKGQQDPKEANTGTVFEQFKGELTSPTATAAMLGTNDEGMGNIIAKNLGDRVLRREKDANGSEILVTRGADGQEQRGYVNKPGLDSQDAWRAFYGAAPYVIGGGVAGQALKGAGIGINALAQGTTAAATSAAGDVGAQMQGSEQGVDGGKALVMGVFGAAGPVASAAAGSIWRKLVTIPGLFDKQSGMLTAKGVEAARKAGIDPADITPDFAKSFAESFAKTKDAGTAATQASLDRYGIPATRGQVTKRKDFLHQEENARWGGYGEDALLRMQKFDKDQAEALRYAALGGKPVDGQLPSAPSKGVAEVIAPDRMPGTFADERSPGTLGQSVKYAFNAAKDASKAQESALWKGVDDLKATPEALAELPAKINGKLAGETDLLPAAQKMDEVISGFMGGEVPTTTGKTLKVGKTESIDAFRRRLGDVVEGTAPGTPDNRQAKMIYNAVTEWISESAEKQLLAGNPEAALNMVKARGFHRDAMAIFKPKNADGSAAPAANRLKGVLNADSGEAVIEKLFGASGGKTASDGVVGTLKNIKAALKTYTPEQADQAWGDIGLAYWSRLVVGKNGEMLGPKAIEANIKQAMHNQQSVFAELFTNQQRREIVQYLRAVEMVAYKPPNASGSSYGLANIVREQLSRVIAALMNNKVSGTVINTALGKTGVADAYGRTVAAKAMQAAPIRRPNLTPAITAAGSVYNQSGRR